MSVTGETGLPPEQAAILDAAGPSLAARLEATEARIAELAATAGPSLAPPLLDTLSAGGKRLRPMLLFLCAGEPGAPAEGGVLRAAVSIELLHMATLVHDDVLDRSPLRRGRPTIYAAAGRLEATAAGDLLLSRAFSELVAGGSEEAVRELSAASSALVRGELMQRADAFSLEVTPERYAERCELKTARLFEAASRLGSLLGTPGAVAADALGGFGKRIGLAFQILDDVLDIEGPPERTGKPRGTDLLDGTVTLPLILALEADPALRKLDLAAIGSSEQAAEVCDRIAATGALALARERALAHVAEAKGRLDELDLDAARRRPLELVADAVVARYS